MNFIEKFTSTKYRDFEGNISIDFHGISENLVTLCKDKGIDTDQFFPIGFSASDEDALGVGHHSNVLYITVYGVQNDKGDNFDQIAKMIEKNGGVADVITHQFELPFLEIGKYIKRFSFMAIGHMRDHISELNVL